MVWYSHLFKSFPQFVMIHTVKDFSVVNEIEIDAFLEFPCFLYDSVNIGNLISGSCAFSKPSSNIWNFDREGNYRNDLIRMEDQILLRKRQ